MLPVKRSFNRTLAGRRLVDSTSKFFIISEALFGLNRVSLLRKLSHNQNRISATCTTLWVLLTIVISFIFAQTKFSFHRFASTLEYVFLCIVSFLLRNRLKTFYVHLDKFDAKLGCRVESAGGAAKKCTLFCILYTTVFFASFAIAKESVLARKVEIYFSIVIWSVHNCEYLYFSYLQSMITSRIELIIGQVEDKLRAPGDAPFSCAEMRKFIKLYHMLITAFDKLMDAFKWQLITMLFVPFIGLMHFLLKRLDEYLSHKEIYWIYCVVRLAVFVFPLLWASMFAEQLAMKVVELRKKVFDYMYQYDKRIDPKGHELLSILIALTKLRDLSCVLFGMVRINTGLPIKVVSLLFTYLAVMLQFRKVMTII